MQDRSDDSPDTGTGVVDINGIMDMIPHRYPFLMIDKVVDIVPSKSATGIKCVTMAEPHFQGHFPVKPIMTGVLIIEAMAQTAAVLVVHSTGLESQGKVVYFMSIDNARFRKPVVPGDVISLKVETLRQRGNVWKLSGKALVEDQVVSEAVFAAMIADS
ncbi:MAG: 3-hydroxyacyl-ACP dehydratase FabZ [Rickettsiales bacterium]